MPSLHRSATRTLPKREDKTRATVAHKVVLPTPPAQEAKASAVPEPGARRGCGEAMRNLSLTSNAESSARRGMLLWATGTGADCFCNNRGCVLSFAALRCLGRGKSAIPHTANVRFIEQSEHVFIRTRRSRITQDTPPASLPLSKAGEVRSQGKDHAVRTAHSAELAAFSGEGG